MIKKLDLTPELRAALDSVQKAEAAYAPGRMSASLVEIPKLGLADAVLYEVHVQTEQARLERLQRLPRTRPVAVVDLQSRRKRKRSA